MGVTRWVRDWRASRFFAEREKGLVKEDGTKVGSIVPVAKVVLPFPASCVLAEDTSRIC